MYDTIVNRLKTSDFSTHQFTCIELSIGEREEKLSRRQRECLARIYKLNKKENTCLHAIY